MSDPKVKPEVGQQPVQPDQVMRDRYHILRLIGRGISGTVWLARDKRTNSNVALKVVYPVDGEEGRDQGGSSESSLLRALQETGEMRSRPIVDLLDSFETEAPYPRRETLVLELLGINLGDVIMHMVLQHGSNGFRLSTTMSRQLARRMVEAVAYIHTKQIMHRGKPALTSRKPLSDTIADIQPYNFMFRLPSQDGQYAVLHSNERILRMGFLISADPLISKRSMYMHPVEALFCVNSVSKTSSPDLLLMDFGSGSTFSDANDGGHSYPLDARPPESMLGLPLSPKADIWALGCTIFQLVTLTSPFYVDDFMSGQEQDDEHLQSIVEALGPMPPDLSERWANHDMPTDDPFKDSLSVQIEEFKPKDLTDGDAVLFEDFIRSMLCWQAEQRQDAVELLNHPWINDDK